MKRTGFIGSSIEIFVLMKFCSFFLLFFFSLVFVNAREKTPVKSVTRPITIGQMAELNSKILGEKRTLNIYLPDGYQEQDSQKYPVIYLLDGGLSEDFLHIVGLVQYAAFEWIQWLPRCI